MEMAETITILRQELNEVAEKLQQANVYIAQLEGHSHNHDTEPEKNVHSSNE